VQESNTVGCTLHEESIVIEEISPVVVVEERKQIHLVMVVLVVLVEVELHQEQVVVNTD